MSEELHVLELLPAYALGSLEESEAQFVAVHLAGCILCREELTSYQAVADQLAWMTPDASPSAGLKPRLMERVQAPGKKQTAEPRWQFPRTLAPAGALLLVLVAALAVFNILLWQRLENLQALSGPNGMRAITLQSTDAAPLASGFILIGANGMNGALVVDEMTLLEEGYEYQLWLTRDGQDTSAAIFSVDESGYRGVRVEAPESLFVYSSVKVTIEPAGGSTTPTGKQVLEGSLLNP